MNKRKSGVAVIIVLGLLALLMVLAVSFSVSMRVERAGAANYASAARTRQMVWAGLARAIGDINVKTPDAYPSGDFLVSGGSAWGTNGASGVRLLTGKARDYVPDVYLDLGYDSLRSQWLPLGGGDDREGYIAYTVLNLSDMLDLNYVGGAAVREGGTNATELVLDSIGVDGATLASARGSDGPFESLAEFKALYPGISSYALSAYSRYPQDTNRVNAVYIGGTVADLIGDENAIVSAIQAMALAGGQGALLEGNARAVFTNLLDYIDEDSLPRNLAGPNTEAVPMLNEIAVTNVFLSPPAGPLLQAVGVRGDIETWYPFLEMNRAGLDFRVRGDYRLEVTVTDPVTSAITAASSNATFTSAQNLNYRTQRFARHNPYFAAAVLFPGGVSVTNTSPITVDLSISNLTVFVVGTGEIVDQVDGVFTFSGSGTYSAFPGIQSSPSYQTIDPRYNWDRSLPYCWVAQPAHTIGTTNVQTAAVLATGDPRLERGGFWLHVSDRGRLDSPLEFGNLAHTDLPASILQTFRVFRQARPDGSSPYSRHHILENFTLNPVGVERGLVNANSRDPFIIETAFRNMPTPYVGGPPVSAAVLSALTNMIYNIHDGGETFEQLVDLLDHDWRAEPALTALSNAELEALAAYSTGLLGVRQNLFLIVVSASAGSEGMGEDSRGEVGWRGRQRALALVWRDPVANPQGLHDCFIRMFMMLN